MSLLEKLNETMKQAMRDKDKDKLGVIRLVKASLQNEAINLGVSALSAEQEITILSRELKQRQESLKEFQAAGRDDLINKTEADIRILQAFLPEQLSEAEVEQIVIETIANLNATKKDFGKVMGAVIPKVKGKADGAIVQKFVKQHLI